VAKILTVHADKRHFCNVTQVWVRIRINLNFSSPFGLAGFSVQSGQILGHHPQARPDIRHSP